MNTTKTADTPKEDPRANWGPSYLDASRWSWVPSWLYPYLRPEMLAMLMLGFASGLPLYLFYSKTSIWLRTEGIEKSTIGFFYWIGLAYTLKWVWAPVIDKTVVPILGRMFGHRRSWMMISIVGTVAGLFILSAANPSEGLGMVLVGAGLIAFSGATLDVSIDAWRIESAPNKAQANMAATYSLGYRGAFLFSGLGLVIAGHAGWAISFIVMGLAMAVCAGLVALITEPKNRREAQDLDHLPFFAGAWNAVAFGTAIFLAARILRWFKADGLVIDGLAIAAIVTMLIGGFLLKGTKSSLLYRIALSGIGVIFIYAREIADLLVNIPEDSAIYEPFFKLAVVLISLSAIGVYARLVFQSNTDIQQKSTVPHHDLPRGKLYALFVTPLEQVWDRFGKVLIPILLLVLIYRTSDFTMGVMAGPLYVDLGYSPDTIGWAQTAFGFWFILIGLFIGGFVANQIGVMRALVIGAILTFVTTGFYAYFAAHATGTDPLFLAFAICADNVAGGFVTTVFIAYLSSLVDPAFAATQYALFSSLYALLNKLVAGFSGVLVDAVGYVWFFLITASYAIPAGILVLVVMRMQSGKTIPQSSVTEPAE